jgi:DNA-binding PadR family transcriptional regulator
MGRKSIGWKNLWSLTVLVFLRLKPMHPYELQSVIKVTHKEDFLQLKPGSLYNSIDRLLEAELIEVAETSRAGRRPERTVYRITKAGRQEMIKWLRELLEKPGPDTTWFYAALSFLPAIEARETAKQLQKRVQHLQREVETYKQVLTDLVPRIGRLPLIEVEYVLAMRSAEREWVEQIIKDLNTGKLDWNPAMVRKHAAHLFDNCQPPNGQIKQ